ncbi:MAG: RidA family protein [Phycisphaerae bacterium]|nr:RidA family protein [Phycisphaerae bacterium]
MTPQQKLEQLGIELREPAKPVGAYIPAVRVGNLVYTSGQLPMDANGQLAATGKVPSAVSLEDAKAAARLCLTNALAAVLTQTDSIDNIVRIVRLNVFVNSEGDFTDQAAVANGASELLGEIFGTDNGHTRCAIGAAALPLDTTVELDIIAEVK